MRLLIFLFICLSALSSCATLFSRGSDKVTFKTEPIGADLYVDGENIGKTPLTQVFQRSTFDKHYITVTKKGYETQKFLLKKSINGKALFNCTSFLSWGTDALTGHLLEYQPNSYFIDLKRNGRARVAPKAEIIKYVLVNHNKILGEIVKGNGEVLQNYADIMGVKEHQYPEFKRVLIQNLPKLIQYNEPDAFQLRVQELLTSKKIVLTAISPEIL